jgi:hypothetical protein
MKRIVGLIVLNAIAVFILIDCATAGKQIPAEKAPLTREGQTTEIGPGGY